ITVIEVKFANRFYQQVIHRHPDGAAPIGVAAKKARVRFAWEIRHSELGATVLEDVGMFEVVARKGADAEGREEFLLIEHLLEEAFHAVAAEKRQQVCFPFARVLPVRDEAGEFWLVFEHP